MNNASFDSLQFMHFQAIYQRLQKLFAAKYYGIESFSKKSQVTGLYQIKLSHSYKE